MIFSGFLTLSIKGRITLSFKSWISKSFKSWILLTSLLLCSGCGTIFMGPFQDPNLYADTLAVRCAFNKELVKTKDFTLTSYHKPFDSDANTLTVYIEGDGRSWARRNKISDNPTPLQPLVLKLAMLDKSSNVAYLARPCQYTPLENEQNCVPDIWTFQRFSEKVISNMNEAITKLKQESGAEKINLVGFSGGGAVVVLVAARRNDVVNIKTIAGDLDYEMMTEYHQTTPLTDCLNPKHFAGKIAHIPQYHYVGAEDPVVPSYITESFVQEIAKTHPKNAHLLVLPKVSHQEGWEKLWPKFCEDIRKP